MMKICFLLMLVSLIIGLPYLPIGRRRQQTAPHAADPVLVAQFAAPAAAPGS
jgi:hypothetical protein